MHTIFPSTSAVTLIDVQTNPLYIPLVSQCEFETKNKTLSFDLNILTFSVISVQTFDSINLHVHIQEP